VSKKRGNGEGSITKRKDGRWMARYTVHTAGGRKRKTIYGKTRAEVAEKLAKAVMDRADGLVFDVGSLRLFEYLERWLADSVRDTVRATTYENYAYLVRTYIVPSLGHIKLKALTPAQVQRFYREKLDGLRSFCPNRPVFAHVAAEGSQASREVGVNPAQCDRRRRRTEAHQEGN